MSEYREGARSGSSLSLILCRNEPQKKPTSKGESSRSLHASTTSDIHVPLLPRSNCNSNCNGTLTHSLTRSQAPDSWKSLFFRPFFNEIPKCWEIKSLNCIIHSPTCFLIDAHTQRREIVNTEKGRFPSHPFSGNSHMLCQSEMLEWRKKKGSPGQALSLTLYPVEMLHSFEAWVNREMEASTWGSIAFIAELLCVTRRWLLMNGKSPRFH